MRYYVTLDAAAKPSVVDIIERLDGSLDATIDGSPVAIDVVAIGRQLSIRVDGRVLDVTTHGKLPDLGIVARGFRGEARVESERSRSRERANAPGRHGDRTVLVKSPMPGRVVRVLVAAGDVVAPGQGLIVLEAMKMENEVRASVAATVTEILVSAGATVDSNARLILLAVLEP